MLRSLGSNKSRFGLPTLIKSGVGEVAGLSGSAVSPLLLSGREQAAGIETKQQNSSGTLQSMYSPPPHPKKGPSPRPSPGRPPFYTDRFSEPLRLESTASINSFIMETQDSAQSTDSGKTMSMAISKYEPKVIVVVLDATREFQLAPLKSALHICEPGDNLHILGILHQVMNPMGYKQKADAGAQFNGTTYHVIVEEQRKKVAEFEKGIQSDPELQKLFASTQISPLVHIAPGPDRKVVTARQAVELGAKWVFLDKHLKNDKSYLVEQLVNCYIVLMDTKNIPVLHSIPREQNCGAGPAGDYQQTCDNAQIMIAKTVDKEVSKSFSQISISSSAPCSSSTSLLEQLSKTNISAQTAEQIHLEGHSARTDLSCISFSPSLAEVLELDVASEQFSDPDISSAKGISSTGSKRDEMTNDSDRDRQSESGPGISSELDKVCSEFKDDTLNPTVKVGSIGTSSTDDIYKITGRPSMSTGDLQSLVPKTTSVATLYRPAPRSFGDRGGDELINILNYIPSTPSATPRSVRTLQRSLQEEDLISQAPNLSNNPIGRVNKVASQNEDNRRLLDNSHHGKRKTPRPIAPLCSVCRKPGPKFGCDAKEFTYAELEAATDNFDQENYIAEGGYGFVYRGKLEGGQEIAVKQYKAASSQGDDEFDAEVQVLKHAQHRNLVILIGYCAENDRRLLVYEFVCNKSLDVHLSAKNVNVLQWKWRWTIAVGAARGLRYLHEECRVGCIVHRDMRPNNILLTHDFVPMVGDFGLARSQLSGAEAEETRVIGTLGYLAPEYAETGSITAKADVYSFGVVLLELITGRKAIDATRARGETCLTEWARPMIHAGKTVDIVDPRLKDYDVEQVDRMVKAAGLCISKDPDQRPRMSEVLRLLERDGSSDSSISRANSGNDLGEISRIQSQNKLAREVSLDSASSTANSKGNRSTVIQGHRAKAKSEKIERSASPRTSLKQVSNSPAVGKIGSGGKNKKVSRALSYIDML